MASRIGNVSGFLDLTAIPLGEHFFLFLPTAPTDNVIISAHGRKDWIGETRKFIVPEGKSIKFYGKDNNPVEDPGFGNFYRGTPRPVEIILAPGECFDYNLSKFQDAKAESYELIAKTIKGMVDFKAGVNSDIAAGVLEEKHLNALREANDKAKISAVLTVRNRWFKGAVTLSNAVSLMRAKYPQITNFDCSICRWNPGRADGTEKVAYEQ